MVDRGGVTTVDDAGGPAEAGAVVLVQRHLAVGHVGAAHHVDVTVAVHVAHVDAEIVEVGGDRVLGPAGAGAVGVSTTTGEGVGRKAVWATVDPPPMS